MKISSLSLLLPSLLAPAVLLGCLERSSNRLAPPIEQPPERCAQMEVAPPAPPREPRAAKRDQSPVAAVVDEPAAKSPPRRAEEVDAKSIAAPTVVAAAPAPNPRAKKERPSLSVDGLMAQSRGAANSVTGMGLIGTFRDQRAVNGAALGVALPADQPAHTETYARLDDNAFHAVEHDPLSTFSIDVDTASYSNVRRFLTSGSLPPKDAVRIEELVNYFPYRYRAPQGEGAPFAVDVEVASCPWNDAHRLARIGIQGKQVDLQKRPGSNLVFLLDVSGSMMPDDRLPLIKRGLRLLVDQLTEKDRVAMVVYAGNTGLVLPSTPGSEKQTILAALDRLEAGGSTNGAAGIQLAYRVAAQNFQKGGINRVILATDGDFNVGVTSEGELTRLIEAQAKTGVYLSVLGVGTDNYHDSTMEKLADRGNGNYAYLDSLREARKVLVEQMSGTLLTIAKDVKIQLELNPAQVAAYRLIGYEDRILAHQDFNDDKKDAGDIGAGHTVTALYELVPAALGVEGLGIAGVDPLKYQHGKGASSAGDSGESFTVKLRYKQPDGVTSKLLVYPVSDGKAGIVQASGELKFAASVAEFGMLLRGSEHAGAASYDGVLALAKEGLGDDPQGHRAEFLELVRRAESLSPVSSR